MGDWKLFFRLKNFKAWTFFKGKTIGEGTFGKVKLGLHLPTGEKVVIGVYYFPFSLLFKVAVKILEKEKINE